ncbi:hypothetical protein BCEN4_1320071 [Burkholderia cenocepacia]|nr:hypothetical protein BCEN4_1320071 [Burkholderia cenocepacia]
MFAAQLNHVTDTSSSPQAGARTYAQIETEVRRFVINPTRSYRLDNRSSDRSK